MNKKLTAVVLALCLIPLALASESINGDIHPSELSIGVEKIINETPHDLMKKMPFDDGSTPEPDPVPEPYVSQGGGRGGGSSHHYSYKNTYAYAYNSCVIEFAPTFGQALINQDIMTWINGVNSMKSSTVCLSDYWNVAQPFFYKWATS